MKMRGEKTFYIIKSLIVVSLLINLVDAKEFITDNGIQIDSMDMIDDWIITNSSIGNITNDTVNFVEGTQGLRLTSFNETSSALMIKTFEDPVDISAYNAIHLWVYAYDPDNWTEIDVSLSNTKDFTEYIRSYNYNTVMVPGWNHMIISKSLFTSVGGDSWNKKQRAIKIRLVAGTGEHVSVTLDDIRFGILARPVAIITFDDGFQSVYDNASNILTENNQKASAFVITSYMQNLPEGYMNLTTTKKLYDIGWDIGSHTVGHDSLTSIDKNELISQLSDSYNYLNSQGFTRSSKFVAYPFGMYNDTVVDVARSSGYVMGRTLSPDTYTANLPMTDPSNMYLKMQAVQVTDSTTVQAIMDKINQTVENNGLMILVFHNIVANGTASGITETNTSTFQDISNYLAYRSADIDVMTIGEYYEYLQVPQPPLSTMTPSKTIKSLKVTSPNEKQSSSDVTPQKIISSSPKESLINNWPVFCEFIIVASILTILVIFLVKFIFYKRR